MHGFGGFEPLFIKGGALALVGLAAVAVVAALSVILPQVVSRNEAPAPVETLANSVAVMPFQNFKDSEDPERYGQILQELIITDLTGFDTLKVLSSQRLFDVQKQLGRDTRTSIGITGHQGKVDKDHMKQLPGVSTIVTPSSKTARNVSRNSGKWVQPRIMLSGWRAASGSSSR